MMRFFLVLLSGAVATWLALTVLPWWVAMPVAFILTLLLPMRAGRSFLATGLGAAITFLLLSWSADHANAHLLSTRMAGLFHLPSYGLMLVLTALLGFVTAGLGGWTGSTLRTLLRKRSEQQLFVSQQKRP